MLFANFAEAMAEGRGKAQADALRRVAAGRPRPSGCADPAQSHGSVEDVLRQPRSGGRSRSSCTPDDLIPGDGEVVEGVASVDESAITGESAPVIRESGGDRSAVTGGTKVLSDFLVIRITANPGETFLDRMIALVEGARRQKTPNEIALTILLSGLTIIFLLAVVTLQPFAIYTGGAVAIPVLIALLVCLIPTTIGGLLSAIGIAGMDRMIQQNVIAMSGRAVEAAGDVNTLLLDKTGTITLGNRQAVEFLPVRGRHRRGAGRPRAARLAAGRDARRAQHRGAGQGEVQPAGPGREGDGGAAEHMTFVPFSAATRMSGVDMGTACSSARARATPIIRWVQESRRRGSRAEIDGGSSSASPGTGGTPLVVAERHNGTARVLGVVHLKDVVKGGMRERFDRLRAMGIRTVMITGDNPLTAAAIAAEAGVDDFLAEATPEDKLALIRKEQAGGRLVAMTGDGTNDAPALAQADVGVAMNTGTQAARKPATWSTSTPTRPS